MQDLKGKVAFVTGGASGIGLGMVRAFAAAGMKVAVADIEQAALDQVKQDFDATSADVIYLPLDVTDRDAMERAAQQTEDAFGKVHVVCNNAGVAVAGRVDKMDYKDWDWVMGVNFNGVLYGLQAFVPQMLAHGESGHVVNTASLAGLMPGGGTYGVSKHGVLSLTETLYNDLQMRNAKISASVLCPGFVDTSIFDAERNRPADLQVADKTTNNSVTEAARAMLAQGKQPQEIAEAVFAAIQSNALYILPHPAWDDFVRSRVDHVLARQGPASMDMEDLLRRRSAGEQF